MLMQWCTFCSFHLQIQACLLFLAILLLLYVPWCSWLVVVTFCSFYCCCCCCYLVFLLTFISCCCCCNCTFLDSIPLFFVICCCWWTYCSPQYCCCSYYCIYILLLHHITTTISPTSAVPYIPFRWFHCCWRYVQWYIPHSLVTLPIRVFILPFSDGAWPFSLLYYRCTFIHSCILATFADWHCSTLTYLFVHSFVLLYGTLLYVDDASVVVLLPPHFVAIAIVIHARCDCYSMHCSVDCCCCILDVVHIYISFCCSTVTAHCHCCYIPDSCCSLFVFDTGYSIDTFVVDTIHYVNCWKSDVLFLFIWLWWNMYALDDVGTMEWHILLHGTLCYRMPSLLPILEAFRCWRWCKHGYSIAVSPFPAPIAVVVVFCTFYIVTVHGIAVFIPFIIVLLFVVRWLHYLLIFYLLTILICCSFILTVCSRWLMPFVITMMHCSITIWRYSMMGILPCSPFVVPFYYDVRCSHWSCWYSPITLLVTHDFFPLRWPLLFIVIRCSLFVLLFIVYFIYVVGRSCCCWCLLLIVLFDSDF